MARELETRGITSVCLMLRREVAEKVKPPRALYVEFGWGQPLGPPGEAGTHRAVAVEALRMAYEAPGPAEIWDFSAPQDT